MSAEDCAAVDDIDKPDLDNELLVELLVLHYSKSIATTNFWLAEIIFHTEAVQYPQRFVADAAEPV